MSDHLAGPAFTRLWARCRVALERSSGAVSGTVSLGAPTNDERQEIGALLRRPYRVGLTRLTVDLVALDAALRNGPAGAGLVDVVARLTGPLRDRPSEARIAVEEIAAARASVGPGLESWLDGLAKDGVLTRLQREDSLSSVTLAARVLAELPAPGVPLAVLAARVAGHAKALDAGTLPTLVLRALALAAGEPMPTSAWKRRRLWDANGVVVDPLSSQVLVLGLGESADGEPRRWTLRQLRHTAPPNEGALWVCENPAVVAVAADRLGEHCPPLLCTEGQPSTAARLVVDAAAEVHWHNDYDWPGVRMTAAAITRHAAVPWRMSASDYEEAVATTDPLLQRALEGRVAATPWDPDLAAAMSHRAVAVEEELVVERLVADLT